MLQVEMLTGWVVLKVGMLTGWVAVQLVLKTGTTSGRPQHILCGLSRLQTQTE